LYGAPPTDPTYPQLLSASFGLPQVCSAAAAREEAAAAAAEQDGPKESEGAERQAAQVRGRTSRSALPPSSCPHCLHAHATAGMRAL
jgi:hypothetical protein